MNDYKKGMGLRIKARRRELKITQETMAEALGVSVKHFSEVERGLTGISVENLLKLGELLNVSMDHLLRGEEEPSPWEPLLHRLREIPPEKQGDLEALILAGVRLAESAAQENE